ncbi:small ubiquitin like modifier 2a isoform X1 [Perca flavescens]|uniref:small ubiquitin like modifier 2a isoform X1 n=1 Tax=Perca flavescens TaxID=8167 RepID=UPI00106E11C3|nr:small ubiquitin-related modifier 5 isoform X1 [Perca flavescens]
MVFPCTRQQVRRGESPSSSSSEDKQPSTPRRQQVWRGDGQQVRTPDWSSRADCCLLIGRLEDSSHYRPHRTGTQPPLFALPFPTCACVNLCLVLQVGEGVKTENNEHINLKVAGQDGSVVQFKIKRHTPLSKLMKAYCERQGLSMRQIRFRFDGQPINETDTPSQLEMEDEDTIDVFQQQTGGSSL